VIVTPQIVVRLALIVLTTVLLQFGFFSQVPILGSVANLLPVVVVSLGLLGGAVTGSVIGFVTGLLIDVLIGGTLGVASLSLMAAGYLAGRWREGVDERARVGALQRRPRRVPLERPGVKWLGGRPQRAIGG